MAEEHDVDGNFPHSYSIFISCSCEKEQRFLIWIFSPYVQFIRP